MSSTPDIEFPDTGVVIPTGAGLSSGNLVEFAARADSSGFDSVWVSEEWGYGPFALLGQIAERTDCVLGTCVANVFSRSPVALAMNALAIHDASDGFILGLGSSTPTIVEQFHGQAFEQPIRRVRETVEIVETALSGDRIDYDGEVFEVSGFRLEDADGVTVPVVNAALGTTNMAMSLDYADGLLLHLLPVSGLDDAIESARERARSPRVPHIAASIPTAIGSDVEEARTVLARHIAYYAGESSFYNDVIAKCGYRDEAARIRAEWTRGNRSAAVAAVSHELQDDVGIAGKPQRARTQVAELRELGVDTVLISFPRDATPEMYDAALSVLPPAEH